VKVKTIKFFTEDDLDEFPKLPDDWKWVKIGNLTFGIEYGTSAKSEKLGQIPVLRMGNIQNGRLDWSDLVYTNDKAEIEKYLLKKNDVLFNRTNSPELVGKTAIYKGERPAIFAGYLIRINQLPELVAADYLNYFLNSPIAKVYGNSVKTDGVNQSNINGEKLRNYPFPLPPLPEQRAIVSKIEQLFSELDNGISNLKLAQEQLKVYRQAVLDKTTKTRNFVPINTIINELGQGWSPKCHNEPSNNNEEWGVIKTTAIQAGYFNEQENKKLPANLEPRVKHELKTGDILITRAGPRVRVGICCLVKKVRPRLINCDKAYRIRLKENLIAPQFFEYTLNSPKYIRVMENIKTGINDSGVNLTQNRFLDLEIPLPPLPEQQIIVQEIETRLSVCDKIEQDIETNLEKAEALRQSILKKAFEGKLLNEKELAEVRGAEDWESAEALLERIKAERVKNGEK